MGGDKRIGQIGGEGVQLMNTVYDAQYFEWQKTIGEFGGIANLFKFESHIGPADAVLDFGCGGGYLLKNLNCARRIGLEVNPTAAQRARENGIECHATLDTIADSSIDVVISNHALEHVPSPFQALSDLKAKLIPNGRLVIVVPCEATITPYDYSDINNHLYTWNPQLLGNLARAAGFTVEEVNPIFHKWPPRFLEIQKKLGWKLFNLVARLYGRHKRLDFQVKLVATNSK